MFSMGLMAKAAAGKLDGKYRYVFHVYKDGVKIGQISGLGDTENDARKKIAFPPGASAVLAGKEDR